MNLSIKTKKLSQLISILILGTMSFHSYAASGNHFKKVVMVVFENTNYGKAILDQNFKAVANNGVSFTNMIAATHPSQGNYVNMIAGSTFGITNDKNIDLPDSHIGDLLEKAGMRWKVYAEDFPGNCFLPATSGLYARKHVPFLSFKNVTGNPTRCLNIEDTTRFQDDLKTDSLPEFSMYIPNLKNDGHNTGVEVAGKWLAQNFGSVLNNPEAMNQTLFIITFDESGASMKNQIYTVLVGKQIKKGTTSNQLVTHAALLKMIEDEFQLGNLGRDDSKAEAIQNIWQ